ncbi:hypothetical protein [Oryzobacter telluris]|uniref:hypothetical protein n=1 Tax=Oryzobacter telluris TaxID=3149179 RepID=UPI00370DD274
MLLIDAFGSRWRLDVSGLEPDLAAHLEDLWRRASIPEDAASAAGDGSATPEFVVTRGEDTLIVLNEEVVVVTDDELPYAVSRAVTHASILRRTGTCLMLHAAGFASPDGATVALVAPSGTGKTTAARVLGRRLGYVSDETVAVEDDLRVRAYAKPLSVVVDPAEPMAKTEHSPDELGLLRAPDDLHLVATVVLERTDDVEEPVLEPFALVDAAALALPQTSALPSLERPLERLATVLTAGHGPWRMRYREIGDCAALVEDLAAGRAPGGEPETVQWTWIGGTAPASAAVLDPSEDVDPPEPREHGDLAAIGIATEVVRAPFGDALASDGSVLVLHERVPSTLPGLAATLWLAAEHPVPVSRLVEEATADLGPHPEAEALVIDAVRSLVERDLLRVAAEDD